VARTVVGLVSLSIEAAGAPRVLEFGPDVRRAEARHELATRDAAYFPARCTMKLSDTVVSQLLELGKRFELAGVIPEGRSAPEHQRVLPIGETIRWCWAGVRIDALLGETGHAPDHEQEGRA
jgi:hypothetical protein